MGSGQVNVFAVGGVEYATYHYYDSRDGGRSRLGRAVVEWDADGWPRAVAAEQTYL